MVSSGHVLVEAAVAGLHVVDGNAHPLGHHRRQAAVGVAEDQHGVRPLLEQHLLGLDQHLTEHAAEAAGVDLEEVVGRAQSKLGEEDLIEVVVVVLTRVDQDVLDGARRAA